MKRASYTDRSRIGPEALENLYLLTKDNRKLRAFVFLDARGINLYRFSVREASHLAEWARKLLWIFIKQKYAELEREEEILN